MKGAGEVSSVSQALAKAATAGLRGQVRARDRDRQQRYIYAEDPWAYFRDILRATLTPQQDKVLEAVLSNDFVAIQSANNVGKSFLLGGLGVWLMDSVAAEEDRNGDELGARLLLPGPNLGTVRATIWKEVQSHIGRAESQGYAMPGRRYAGTTNPTLWKVHPGWECEAMSPPKHSPDQRQAHSAAGRHAENQWAIGDKAAGPSDFVA